MSTFNDMMNANLNQYQRLQREAQDALIAQKLLEAERKRLDEEEQKDREFALSLQREEERAEAARVMRVKEEGTRAQAVDESVRKAQVEAQARAEAERARVEAERARERARVEAKRELERKDAELAQKMEAEEKKRIADEKRAQQLRDDENLARQLSTQLNLSNSNVYAPPSPPPMQVVSRPYPYYVYPPLVPVPQPAPAVNVVNAHTQHIHRQYCGCAKNNTWDANHILKVHAAHCACAPAYGGHNMWNEGRAHVHTHACCRKNHVHTQVCACVYRNHVHTSMCCTRYHTHNQYCHCTHK